MSIAFVFPGQGSQVVGMGKDLYDNFTEAREVFDEVNDSLKQNLSDIIFNGDQEILTLTENAQPALMAVSMSVIRILQKQGNMQISDKVSCVAGHSLGEYSALSSVDVLSVTDSAKLLKLRGQSMQKATPKGVGAMATILGLELNDVKEIVTQTTQEQNFICNVANDNANGQVVISGHREAVEKVIELAKDKGAKRSVLLNVSAPFHCQLMEPVIDVMKQALNDTILNDFSIPVISNVTADIVDDKNAISELLVQQICSTVRWRETILKMSDLKITNIVECGAGKVLSGLTKRIDKNLSSIALNTPNDIENFLKNI